MRKPDPKTATKEEVERFIRYLLGQHPAFKGADIMIDIRDTRGHHGQKDHRR